jgi:O-antigen/teichoic acid export membrane protein
MAELGGVGETSAPGGFHLFLGNLLSEALNAVTIVVVARVLSPEDMGVYGLSLVLPGIFSIFSELGLRQALTRYVARFKGSDRWGDVVRVVKVGLLVPGVVSCLLAAFMYLAADFLAVVVMKRPMLSGILMNISVLVVVQTVYAMATGVFYGLERMDIAGYLRVITSGVKMVSALYLVHFGFGVLGLIYGHLFGVSVASILSVPLILVLIRRKGAMLRASSESSLFEVLRFGFPLYLTTFLLRVEAGYKGLLLSWFSDIVTIGNLDIANKFLSLIAFFTLPMTTVVFPAFSKFTFGEQPEKLRVLYRTSVRFATLVVFPVATAIIIHSSQGIEFLFGSR